MADSAPNYQELATLLKSISQHIARALVRQGVLVSDESATYLADEERFDEEGARATLRHPQSHSVSYLISVGPRAGQ